MTVTGVFSSVAGVYAAARPGYPAELYERLAELAGRGLDGALVADVGAGTGIAARQLRDRGARVVAIEPSQGMLAELAASCPGVDVVRGDGNALPLRDHSVDFVTYAQAWHWIDPDRAGPEFRRVLRPGGALAAWWNVTDRQETWALLARRRGRPAGRGAARPGVGEQDWSRAYLPTRALRTRSQPSSRRASGMVSERRMKPSPLGP